jgi:hypothetical protein
LEFALLTTQKVTIRKAFVSKPASIKIHFLFHIIHLVLLIFLDTLLGSVLHPSFSCQDITPIFADTILLKKKKRQMENPRGSRSEGSEKVRPVLARSELVLPGPGAKFCIRIWPGQLDSATGRKRITTMNKTFAGTTTKDTRVAANASASMCVNSESVSNKIYESDLQYEKYDEQRI